MAISGKWIRSPQATDLAAVSFEKDFALAKPVKKAVLRATAMGVYVPTLNGKRVGDSVLMPGWTAYEHRVLFQTYDGRKTRSRSASASAGRSASRAKTGITITAIPTTPRFSPRSPSPMQTAAHKRSRPTKRGGCIRRR